MRSLFICLASLMLLTGCIDLNGNFTAHEKLSLVHTTIFGNEKVKKVPAGTYKTLVTFSSSEKVKLSFKGNGKDIDVKIKLPSRDSFPRGNGRIDLPASVTGQRYDIQGFIDSDVSYGATQRGRETCTYTDYETRCTNRCDQRGNCRRHCERVSVTRNGWQHVEYRYETTERFLKLEMVKPRSSAIVGNYRGTDRDSRKVYLHQGRCF